MVPAIPPIGSGAEFVPPSIGDVTGPAQAAEPQGGGFGAALEKALGALVDSQKEAAVQSQALATGQAQSIDSVVLAVEKASLSLELAAQVRNKAVEAYQDIFRMQV
jgi:flagellar hook-basal body complex protein FliE